MQLLAASDVQLGSRLRARRGRHKEKVLGRAIGTLIWACGARGRVFLASDLAKQVTGAEYTVNGGSYVAA
jgi:hypothetical protein